MIVELAVRDLGVFAEAQLVFGDGLHVLTGETGAGKSLVVGAIELLLGGRADAGVVRPGATEAVVDGRFVDEQGNEVVLSRVVPASGRSRSYIGGRPVSLAELAERTAGLVELHGQHAHQQLLRPAAQRDALDRHAGVDLGPLREARSRVRDLRSRLDDLGGDDRARARELDLLRHQLDELAAAAIEGPDEDLHLDAEEDSLADAVAHREAAAAAAEGLAGDGGVVHQLHDALAAVSGRMPLAESERRLRDLAAELADVARDLRESAEGIVDDPERLAEVRERRHLLADLRRRYGATLAEVLEEQVRIGARFEELGSHDEAAAALGSALESAEADVARLAAEIAGRRRASAPGLAAGVQTTLRRLAVPAAVVEVEALGDDPADDVAFLLSANPGAPPQPMAKVASGGELSRVTLALRLELTAGPPTLVFDEVDAGIGGEAAWAVGAALHALAERHQILVVTHLAQVAAFAGHHFRVAKESGPSATEATVAAITGEARLEELARVLSGRPDSALSREHALELLETAGRLGAGSDAGIVGADRARA